MKQALGQITEAHWKIVDKIGIARHLLSKQPCGLWFKTIGGTFCVTDEQKLKLVTLNTKILSIKN